VLVLAIDTCDARGSVALLDGEDLLATMVHDSPEDYSSWLLPAVQRALDAAGRKLTDVIIYAAAAGPGSFTGIRIALTTVKAWHEVFHRPIAAVSRLEALAIQAVGASGSKSPQFIVAATDAQRGQLYAAVYRRKGQSLQRLGHEAVVTPAELLRWAAEEAEDAPVVWVSLDTASLAAQPAWQDRVARGEVLQQLSPILAPAIGKIALQLAAQNRLTDALSLDANYIRRPDAEVKWKGYTKSPALPVAEKPRTHCIRPFQPADAGAVAQLAAASPEAAQWPERSYAELLSSGYSAWIAVDTTPAQHNAGAIAGFLITRTIYPEAEILNLAVAPQNRRTGVAAALLDAALGELAGAKVQRVFLEVRASNSPAISFYKKHLFRSTGARLAYYRQPSEDAVLMERTALADVFSTDRS